MLIGVAFLVCLISVPLAGGRLTAVGDFSVRAAWLLMAALAVQVVIVSLVPGGGPAGLHAIAHVATYCMAGVFAFANRGVPFFWLIALGGALNFAAIAANGGVMPAAPDALLAAGVGDSGEEFTNSRAVASAKLQFLGDVFAVPASWPVSNVFSIGDVVIVAGAFAAVHTLGGSRFALPGLASPSALVHNLRRRTDPRSSGPGNAEIRGERAASIPGLE